MSFFFFEGYGDHRDLHVRHTLSLHDALPICLDGLGLDDRRLSGNVLEPLRERDVGKLALCRRRSEEHTSELQSLMRTSYAVFCLKKKTLQKVMSNMKIIYNSKTQYKDNKKTVENMNLL